VIVELNGPARGMPWNSSKSGINFAHPAFQALRPTLVQLVSHFSSLSRRLKDDWPNKVYRYPSGTPTPIDPADVIAKRKLVLPPLPRVNKPQVEKLKTLNKTIIKNQPWTLGLIEAFGAVDIISRQKLDTKNRIALILLYSNFEISLKEFIVHRTDLFPASQYTDASIRVLFKNRSNVIKEIQKKITIPTNLLTRAQHYYGMRNKLIHERATLGATDADIWNYKSTVAQIMKILFGIRVAG
jgi:hypothetical protein